MGLVPSARWRARGLAGAGLLAILLAYAMAALPEGAPAWIAGPVAAVRRPLVEFVRGLGPQAVAWLLAAVAGLYALVRLARGRDRPAVAPQFVDRPPEEVRTEEPTADDEFEVELQRATFHIVDPRDGGTRLRARIRQSAVDVVARAEDCSTGEARRLVETGEWTDDRIAAAFLADEGPGYPLRARIRGWLRPELAFERRVERTIDAVHERKEAR